MSTFQRLPIEIRDVVYDILVTTRQNIVRWDGSHSQPRSYSESRSGIVTISSENWKPDEPACPPRAERWLSSMISLSDITPLMRTCKQIHAELSELVYGKIIWHARVGRYSVPALPLQLCPSYARHVRHFSLHLHHGNSLDGILEGTDHVYIKFSSFWRNLHTFAKLLASQRKLKSLQIDTLVPSEQAVIDVVEALVPLAGHVEEVKVGRLGYESYNRSTFACERHLSNAGYQKLKAIFQEYVAWSFPFIDAQYKD